MLQGRRLQPSSSRICTHEVHGSGGLSLAFFQLPQPFQACVRKHLMSQNSCWLWSSSKTFWPQIGQGNKSSWFTFFCFERSGFCWQWPNTPATESPSAIGKLSPETAASIYAHVRDFYKKIYKVSPRIASSDQSIVFHVRIGCEVIVLFFYGSSKLYLDQRPFLLAVAYMSITFTAASTSSAHKTKSGGRIPCMEDKHGNTGRTTRSKSDCSSSAVVLCPSLYIQTAIPSRLNIGLPVYRKSPAFLWKPSGASHATMTTQLWTCRYKTATPLELNMAAVDITIIEEEVFGQNSNQKYGLFFPDALAFLRTLRCCLLSMYSCSCVSYRNKPTRGPCLSNTALHVPNKPSLSVSI